MDVSAKLCPSVPLTSFPAHQAQEGGRVDHKQGKVRGGGEEMRQDKIN